MHFSHISHVHHLKLLRYLTLLSHEKSFTNRITSDASAQNAFHDLSKVSDWFKMPWNLIKWNYTWWISDVCARLWLHVQPDEVADMMAATRALSSRGGSFCIHISNVRRGWLLCAMINWTPQSKCEIWDNSASTSVSLTTILCMRLECPFIRRNIILIIIKAILISNARRNPANHQKMKQK